MVRSRVPARGSLRRAPDGGDDPLATALFAELLASVAEEMGVQLQRSAFSPNVKERRDYSCAVFLGDGTMVAQAAHIPVHLGSFPLSVAAALEECDVAPGDEIILNDPFRGGTHLPDVTVVRPVFLSGGVVPDFLVANRAHHADIGGAQPGSMGLARDIHGEGFRIPPVHLRRDGEIVRDVLRLFRAQVRQPDEREGDLRAQTAANLAGERRLAELVREHSLAGLTAGARGLCAATSRALRKTLTALPDGAYTFEDQLDDDGCGSGPVVVRVLIEIRGDRARIDFAGTAPQVAGPMNANYAIVLSAVAYVFRCLIRDPVPMNSGILEPLEIHAPASSVVNASEPAAVAAGNVETSQRIVDVLFGALSWAAPGQIPAASCGTMTNLSLGGEGFTYYETVGGGAGAGPTTVGASCVQTHMTNTLNTPIEMLEATYPLSVIRYARRRGSGGRGARDGGDGIDRELVALAPLSASVLAERQRLAPHGAAGGGPGRRGQTIVTTPRGSARLPGKATVELAPGDRIRVRTPGGGGHGPQDERKHR